MSFNPKNTAAILRDRTRLRPAFAIVLGSGFQHALTELKTEIEIPFPQLAGFLPVGVSGHAGKLLIGTFASVPVLILKGRAHFYEGHEMERVTFPMRVLAEFGVRSVLFTNAAGGINRRYRPGDFMIFEDHINGMGVDPLRGIVVPGRARFVDLTQVYDPRLSLLLKQATTEAKLRVHRGVYIAVPGPSYETPAEIRAYQLLGADAIGMSTVPEVIVARQCGMAVAALSCVTNLAARKGGEALSHVDVLAVADRKRPQIAAVLRRFAELQAKGS